MLQRVFTLILISLFGFSLSFCQVSAREDGKSKKYEVEKTEEEWKSILSPEAFDVLRLKATEYAFTGEYNYVKDKGIYCCAGCGNELFDSKTKYNSGSGWPSFYDAIDKGAIDIEIDRAHGMVREEILCSKCGGHLGHVFNDGPKPTGLRYCVNSVALDLKKK